MSTLIADEASGDDVVRGVISSILSRDEVFGCGLETLRAAESQAVFACELLRRCFPYGEAAVVTTAALTNEGLVTKFL